MNGGGTNVQAAEPSDVWFGRARNARKPALGGNGSLGDKFMGWLRRHNFAGLEVGKQTVEAL